MRRVYIEWRSWWRVCKTADPETDVRGFLVADLLQMRMPTLS